MVFRKNSRSRRRVALEPGQIFREKDGPDWEVVKALNFPNETPHYLMMRVDIPSRKKTVSLSALLDRNYYLPGAPPLVKDEIEA